MTRRIQRNSDIDPNENYRDSWTCPFGIVRYGFQFDKNTYFLHRIDGPAKIYRSGRTDYFVRNVWHRVDGPAIEYPNQFYRHNVYFQNGKHHRCDGPAYWLPLDDSNPKIPENNTNLYA